MLWSFNFQALFFVVLVFISDIFIVEHASIVILTVKLCVIVNTVVGHFKSAIFHILQQQLPQEQRLYYFDIMATCVTSCLKATWLSDI